MSTDALLTLVALVVAVVTLLAPERRLDLRMRIRPLDVLIIAVAFFIINIIKFTPVVTALGGRTLGPWKWGLDPELASYTTILVAAAVVVVRIRTASLHPRRIPAFQNLSESLLFAGQFSELLFLLERHLFGLRRLIERKHFASRLRQYIRPPNSLEAFLQRWRRDDETDSTDTDSHGWQRKWKELTEPVREQVARLLPNHEERRKQAERLMERLFLSEPFVDYLSKARPYLALRVLEIESDFFREAFLKILIVSLLRNRNSVLYEEVTQNQNMGQHNRYIVDQLNPVLWFFFGKEFRAEALAFYKPVGDAISDELCMLRHDTADPYRRPNQHYSDDGKWQSSIYIGLCLFDFMITEGLHRGVHWHLWLMYLDSWTEQIVANMSDLPIEVDHTREYPTPYHYLLYEIVWTQRRWVQTACEIEHTLESVHIDTVDLDHDSIAKSAVISMATCLRAVVESENITPEFKGYLLGVVLHGYDDVGVRGDDQTPLAQLYELALMEGGSRYREYEPYRRGLVEALEHVDDKYRHDIGPAANLFERLIERVARE